MDADYWNQHYLNAHIPWDAGAITTPLKAYIDQLDDLNSSILIPGAGNAHEAIYLYQKGFRNLYICDWAATPLQQLQSLLPELDTRHFLCQDFFTLELQVNLLLEQTFFCAISPDLRVEYARKAAELLQYNGKLAGVLFAGHFEKEGPPFGGTAAEYRQYFSPYFDILTMEVCYNSIKPRMGSELFIELQKK